MEKENIFKKECNIVNKISGWEVSKQFSRQGENRFVINSQHFSLINPYQYFKLLLFRSSHPEVFYEKGVLKICSKFTREQPCRSVISIKLLCNVIEITLPHGCSPVNFLHIFRPPFRKDTSGRLLLYYCYFYHSTYILFLKLLCSMYGIQQSFPSKKLYIEYTL